jgi:hypothetical protein
MQGKSTVTESEVESAALTWLKSLGWQVKHGPEIASGTLTAERDNFGQVVLAQGEVRLLKPVAGKSVRRDRKKFIVGAS